MNSIFEQRKEKMVSPLGGIPIERIAYFLKPVVSSVEGPALKLPSLPFSSESEWPLEVSFNGCNHPQRKWAEWVKRMESHHHSVWKAAGVYEAIMSSVYKFHTDKSLIFGMAERWCAETNTFIFPWGEATVTLEDLMILGGFSVLGKPISLSLQSRELVEIKENLEDVHKCLVSVQGDKHNNWLAYFMNSGYFEHEAFLSLWLTRFVLPRSGKHVFPIAVNLARGTRLALAPAVLASIYRDLSLLKQTMIISASSSNDQNNVDILALSLSAPLFFVQVWAWERLLPLKPKQARSASNSGARIGRWHKVKQSNVISVRTAIDSSADTFLWRPYTLALEGWSIPKFYKESEELREGKKVEEEMESCIRCLRVSELVGLDCLEPYRPNRVAMQFGYDQDLPKWIPRPSSSPEVAWNNYCRPVDPDLKLYYPSRLFESDVTIQYLKLFPGEAVLRGLRSKRRLKRISGSDEMRVNSVAQNLVIEEQERGEGISLVDVNLPDILDLEVRMAKLEKLVAYLKRRRILDNTKPNAQC